MDNTAVLDIGFWQLLAAYVFILALLVIVRARKIGREKEIVIASMRMTMQLVLVGYVLSYIFENDHPLVSVLFLGIMLAFAIRNVASRCRYSLGTEIRRAIALAMTIGASTSLFYFLLVVVQVIPWYTSRYFIPIAGMIIGNSMTGVSLGVNHLIGDMHKQSLLVEGALMLGASPKVAVKEIVNNAFDSAILPTINSMVGMGIVFLPGMMTGQILAGASPLTAIQYQIAIMLGISGSVALSVIVFLHYGYRTFFNEWNQLVLERSERV